MPFSSFVQSHHSGYDYPSTEFSVDVLSRFVCNSLDEALNSGPFDIVIVGSGMYGGYLATRLLQESPAKRVLVLEAGPFLIAEHVQNLPNIGFHIFDPVGYKPYISAYSHPVSDHFCCIGGKSLGWGKWSPRLVDTDLNQWPQDVASHLQNVYSEVEREIGVKPASDLIHGLLYEKLKEAVERLTSPIRGSFPNVQCLEPPIAAKTESPISGLFSFDAFSSVIKLIDAIRLDVAQANNHNPDRRLFLVPRAAVARLLFDDCKDRVKGLEIVSGLGREFRNLYFTPETKFVLAAGSMESTKIVMNSLPSSNDTYSLVGRNLQTHFRSNFTIRVHRSALSLPLGDDLHPAALHLQGQYRPKASTGEPHGRRYHYQLFAVGSGASEESILYRMVPSYTMLESLIAAQREDWVLMNLLTVGEHLGNPESERGAKGTCWCAPSQLIHDEIAPGHSLPRLFAHWELTGADNKFWSWMDEQALRMLRELVSQPHEIEYLHSNGQWSIHPPTDSARDSLASTFHEAGTLWMGIDSQSSVTDTYGRFHSLRNLYSADQSIFPTVGSANPVLTGLALCRRIASDIAR